MELRPKYSLQSLKKGTHSAVREFTDREEPTKAFTKAFDAKEKDSHKVLAYYGIGGIGKTRLLGELHRKTDSMSPSAIRVLLDFQEEKHRAPADALIWLREEFKKCCGIKFTLFDLAYLIYWKKLNPQISLKSNESVLPFLEEGTFIGEVVNQLENVPLAQWLPKTLKFVSGMAQYREMMQWWTGQGKDVMLQLQDLPPAQIEEMLSAYWAEDIRNFIEKEKVPAVIFVDTYEALWEKSRQQGSFHEKDAWVRELILQLPEVLWVICGREKIQWGAVNQAWNDERHLEQHLMGELSEKDSDQFFRSCGIGSEEVRQVIISASHGLPYHLDLAVDTYNVISVKREPREDDFSEKPHEILERFLRYLELPEKETIKILSFTRFWTVEMFQRLVTEFKTGFPSTAYLDLFRFSFISRGEGERWLMQEMMRSSLQQEIQVQDPAFCHYVHTFLFDYYRQRLEAADAANLREADKEAFQEAVYHGQRSMGPSEFTRWFLETAQVFKSGGQFRLIASYSEEIGSYAKNSDDPLLQAALHQFYGSVQLFQGAYDKAVRHLTEAAGVYRILDDPEHVLKSGKCSMDLAEIMVHTNDYDQAFAYLKEGAGTFNSFKGEKSEAFRAAEALLYIRLGKLNIRFSNYSDSMDNYNCAITLCRESIETGEGSAEIFSMMALAYEKLGELSGWIRDGRQREHYMESIDCYKKALSSPDLTDYIWVLMNMGLAYKRLAESFSTAENPSDKIKAFRQAIQIYDQVLTESPGFVDALEKKGHATVDYMVLLIELDLLGEAEESFKDAVETFRKVIEVAPGQGGSRNRLASVHREYSKLLLKRNQTEEALVMLQRALDLSATVLTETPDYIYTDNSIGKTHELIADIHEENGCPEAADSHYKLAAEHYSKMLERASELVEPTEGISRIGIKRIGQSM